MPDMAASMEDIKSINLVSLGCDKNLCDSERMLGQLISEGYVYEPEMDKADAVIINTCCFIGDAKEESIAVILEACELKKEGLIKKLIITGCMAQRYASDITDELSEVDAVVGTNSIQDIVAVMDETRRGERPVSMRPLSEIHFGELQHMPRFVTGMGGYAYLKIAEGCNKRCSYCIIPYLRGPQRSVPMEYLVEEAGRLAADGARELILVAQETSVYGTDLYGQKMLPELLRRLSEVEGISWIRILYCYPEEVTDELIEAIATLPKVCHYLDIPIQHASDHMLRRMHRATTRAEITERIQSIRKRIPDIVLRTTMISGFPGETDGDHQILCEFVREMEFDRLGDFTYSREEGTEAAAFSHQIAKKTKEARRDEIMLIQQDCAFRKAASHIGRELEVLISGRLMDETGESADGNVYVGRTYMDAPDVDGYIYVHTGDRELMTGDMVMARVTGAHDYDLIGELI